MRAWEGNALVSVSTVVVACVVWGGRVSLFGVFWLFVGGVLCVCVGGVLCVCCFFLPECYHICQVLLILALKELM